MANSREELLRLLEDRERAAYERGRRDAIEEAKNEWVAKLRNFIDHELSMHILKTAQPITLQVRVRPAKAKSAVLAVVNEHPAGLSGTEVVHALKAKGEDIPERTIRTSLRRLMKANQIRKRDKRWFPMNAQNTSGEALGTPPR